MRPTPSPTPNNQPPPFSPEALARWVQDSWGKWWRRRDRTAERMAPTTPISFPLEADGTAILDASNGVVLSAKQHGTARSLAAVDNSYRHETRDTGASINWQFWKDTDESAKEVCQ